MRKIGVFDSGIGGLSIANALEKAFPEDTIIFVSDREHMPYGDKPPEVVLGFVTPLLEKLIADGCEIIVIACNTVTTTLIAELRSRLTVPLVGIEPMVKPAALLTKSKVIAVCATPATLQSKRYAWLKQTFTQGVTVLEPDCRQWAYMIEHNQINENLLRQQIQDLCAKSADVIVLGCTHYHWIEKLIHSMAQGRAVVVQPEAAIVARVRHILDDN